MDTIIQQLVSHYFSLFCHIKNYNLEQDSDQPCRIQN